MAYNKFAESVINGAYKKKETRDNTSSQPNNSFADSVINGTYKKIEIDTTPRQIVTSPPVQVNTQPETIPVQSQPVTQPPTEPQKTPLVYEGVSINPNASEEEKLKLIANNNLKQKQGAYDAAYENLKGKRQEYLTGQGVETDPMVRYNEATLDEKLTKPTREEADKISKEANKYISVKDDLANETKNESEALSNANNQLKYAKYLKNVSDVQQEGTDLYDQTIGHLVRGAQDILSNFSEDNRFVDENGNVQYLPSYNALKQQQVQQSYGDGFWGDLARFAGDVGYQGGKIGASVGLNALAPYSGTALYFSDIYGDQYQQNINEGMDNETAMLNAFAKTGQNYVKQWLIGGLGGKLLGKADSSWLEKTLSSEWAKVASDPRVVSILSSMSAEALDEFTDTYMETLIDAFSKKGSNLGDLLSTDTLLEALYSAAVGGATGATGGLNANSLQNAQNAINQRAMANINQQQNITPQTPQIQTNQENNINNQPIAETSNIELNEANNNVQNNEAQNEVENDNNSQVEQDLINEINNEQRKLDNGTSEDDGFHLAELQKELQEVQKKSIADDSNTFNLGKINENTTLNNLRNSEDISNRKVNAYQYDNPEVKPFFKNAAYDLKDALENFTTKGERWTYADGTWGGTKFTSTPEITELKDKYNMSYKDLDKGINGIIKDEGAENNAASKKVELVIDKMLRNGYRSQTLDDTINPNQQYLDTISGKQVDNETNQELEGELPFFTEEEDREFAEKQKQIKEQLEREIKAREQNNNLAESMSEDVLKIEKQPKQKQEITGKTGEQYFKDNGVDEKVAKILSEKPKEEKQNNKETLKNVAGETYRLMVSRGGEVERIAKLTNRPDVKYKYDRSMRARSEAQQHIGSGQTDLNGKLYKNFTNKNGEQVNMSLNDIRKDAKKNGISENVLNQYLADWLNVDRFAEGKPVFGENYTSEMSMENIAKLDKQHPQLNRIADNVWTYEHNELKNLYESGLITENLYKTLDGYKHYVRIQRDVKKSGNNNPVIDKNGHISMNQTIQKATGGNQDILPIMEGIADYTTNMVQNERMNETARELANAIGTTATGDQIIDNEESFGINPDFVKQNDDGTYTLTYFNKGVATQIPINKALYDAFVKNKTVSNIENSKVFKTLTYAPKKLSTMFRNLTTNYNPMFMATNMLKDIGDAPFNSKYTKEFIKVYTSTEGLREVAGNGKYNQLYKRLGGMDDSYFTEGEFNDKTQSKLGKIKDAALSPITKGNEIVESVPRVTEFIATIKANGYEVNQDGDLVLKNVDKAKGKTAQQVIDEALYNAAEVTTNFKRGGDLAKSINRNGGTFFNASIQGFDKQIRNFKDAFTSGSKKQIVGLLTKALIFGIAPTMLNDAMYSGDDEYDELQDYIKDNYYVFKVGDTWVRIPKGRAMSVLGSASRRTKEFASGNSDAFNGFLNFASGQVAPNNPFENNIIAPFLAVKNNVSWSGNKIVPQSMEKRPEAEQYNEKTDEFSKWLGSVTGISPMKINYLIDQYTGGLGDVVLPMITSKSTGTTDNPLLQPLVSKFTFDPAYSNKSVGNFYDAMTELEKKKYSVKADEIDKLKYSYIYSQNQKMAELKKEQSAIQSDNSLSNKEKYEKAKEIQEQINELAKKSLDDLDNIKNNEYYAIVGDNIYYLDDNGDGTQTFKKDAYADSHKNSAEKNNMALYDYYKQQYLKRKEKNSK